MLRAKILPDIEVRATLMCKNIKNTNISLTHPTVNFQPARAGTVSGQLSPCDQPLPLP